jgi:hypothetical protein
MEFINLECNILYLLGASPKGSGTTTPLESRQIYNRFSDIPEKNIQAAIINLQNDGLLSTRGNGHKIFLTSKGLSQIETIDSCLKKTSKYSPQCKVGCCNEQTGSA